MAEENWKSVEEEIKKKALEISPEKLTVPEPYVAIPAIEQLSYGYDSKELRDLYANLLVSSMNVDTKSDVHPSFTSIIKDLCPDEAKLFQVIAKTGTFTVVDVRFQYYEGIIKGGGVTALKNFTDIGDEICEYPDKISLYLENLSRLQLIHIYKDRTVFTLNKDDTLENHPKVKILTSTNIQGQVCKVNKGMCQVTALGKLFIKTCVAPPTTRKEQEHG